MKTNLPLDDLDHLDHKDRSDPIDRVLNGLNFAEPSIGMEQRILQAVECHTSAGTGESVPAFAWLRSLRIGPSLALAAALPLLALTFLHLSRPHPPVGALPANAASENTAPSNGPSLRMRAESDKTTGQMPAPVLNLAGVPMPLLKPKMPKRDATRQTYFLIAALTAPPQVTPAQASAQPASFPAPPMPLTKQEKLLLRLAHRNDPQSLEALIPEKRAAREAQDNSEFETFFPAPKPVEYPALLVSQVNQPTAPYPQALHGDKQ